MQARWREEVVWLTPESVLQSIRVDVRETQKVLMVGETFRVKGDFVVVVENNSPV